MAVSGQGAITVGAFTLGHRNRFDTHQHASHQLAWASIGVLTMGVGDRTWVLPRSRALWIPADIPHDVLANGDTTMVSLYFDPDECRINFDQPTVVDASGLLGHLISHLAGEIDPSARRRAEQVVFDLVVAMPTMALEVPAPTDDRVQRVQEVLQRHPGDQRTLDAWGRAVGASGRTLSRAIERDTGMTFAAWRTQIRLASALTRLAQGQPVGRVAEQVGYATPSAFVAAFRRTTGTSPGQYFRSPSD